MKGLMVSLLFVCMTGIVVGQQSDLNGEANATSNGNVETGESAKFSPSLRSPNELKSNSNGFDFARASGLERPSPDDSDEESVLEVVSEESTTTSLQTDGMSEAERRFRARSGAGGFDGSSNGANQPALRFDFQLTGQAINAIRTGKKIEAAVQVVNPANQQPIPASRFGEIAFFHSDNATKKLTAQTVEPVAMPVGSKTLRFEVDEDQLAQLEQRSLNFHVPGALRGRFDKVEIAGKRPVLDTGGSFGMGNSIPTGGGGGWNVAPVPEPGPNFVPGGDFYVGPVIDDRVIKQRQMASLKNRSTPGNDFNSGFSNGGNNIGLRGNSNGQSIDDLWDQQQKLKQEEQRLLELANANRYKQNLGFDSQNQGQINPQNYQLTADQQRLKQLEAALAASRKAEQQSREQAKSLYQQNIGLNQDQLAMKQELERRNSGASNTMTPVGSNGFGSSRNDFSGGKQYQPPAVQSSDSIIQLASLQEQLKKAKSDNEYLKWQQENMQRQHDVAKDRMDQKYEDSVASAALRLLAENNEIKAVTPTSGIYNRNGGMAGGRVPQDPARFADRGASAAEQLANLNAEQASQGNPTLKSEFGAAISGPNVPSVRPGQFGNNEKYSQVQTATPHNDYSKTLMALLFLLFGSIGLNLYLGWLCRSWYVQYGFLSEELREMFSASSSKI